MINGVFHMIRKCLKLNAIVTEDIKISITPQTALDVGTRLADELALAQCRASYTDRVAGLCSFLWVHLL